MAASPTSSGSTEVFYSYAHEDEPLLGELLKHLGILERTGVIRGWHDRKITAGTEWKGQIDEHLDAAGVILLLVSPDFIASDYCYDLELKRALERHDQGEARVIPVILRPVHGWQDALFGKLGVAPTNGRPVTSWPNRDEAFADVAGHIQRAVEELSGGPSPPRGTPAVGRPIWIVPHRQNPAFTGRGEVLAALRERLTGSGRTALAQAISGLGGIGKTQTAIEYAYRYRDQYQAILWLNAESPLSLKAGCGQLARKMQLPHPEDDLDQAVLALKDWLEAHTGWLLILDNADDPAMLGPFLPDAGQGHILLTSRAHDFQDLDILDPIELPNLPLDDAIEFLLHRCRRQEAEAEERDAAGELARELDGLPLALEQAAAYIHETKAPFRHYLDGYRRRGLALLQARGPALGGYPESVVSTWAANFDAVQEQSPAAVDVLRFSAFLAPDAIPFELLARGAFQLGPLVQQALAGGPPQAKSDQTEGLRSRPRANASFLGQLRLLARLVFRRSRGVNPRLVESSGDTLLVHDLLRPLGCFSLIRIDGHGAIYSIHRLVQEVLKAAMDDTTRDLWAERAVRAVDQAFPPVEYANWPLCGRLLPHALAVAPWIERDCMEFAEAGGLLSQVALYLYYRGQYTDAEPFYQRAMEIRRTALGERHPSYASSLNNLALLYRNMGRHADAEPLCKQAMELHRTTLGERHPDYAGSLNNLANLYAGMGRHADAEPLYKQALAIRRDALGERHPDYARSLYCLAHLYAGMGRHADAEPLYKQAMELYRTTLGERHPDYASSLNNLAGLYDAMGRHADAEPLYKQAMEIHRTALG